MAFLSKLSSKMGTRRRGTKGSTPLAAQASGKRRKKKILLALGAVALLLISPLVISQFRIYRKNLAVENQGWPRVAPLKPSDRLLIISPHCDDETLGAGGTIAAARKIGAKVRIVFMTNGDGSKSTCYVVQARELKAKFQRDDQSKNDGKFDRKPDQKNSDNLFQRIAAMRRREAVAACAKLGVAEKDVIFLGYPDGGMRAMWETNWAFGNPFHSPTTNSSRSPYANSFTPDAEYSGAQVARDLEKIFRQYKPTRILTTHPEDTHGDHWAAYAFSAVALEKLRLDADGSTRQWAARASLLGFLVHHGIWPTPNGYHPQKHLWPPASLVNSDTRWQIEMLSQSAQDAKKSALECYPSQLATTPRYLRAFVRGNELFGAPLKSLKYRDPSSDSSWSEAWLAADIQSLQFQNVSGVIQLQTALAGAPSSRARYQYAIHVIAATQITAWKIEARFSGKNMEATLTKLSGTQQGNNGNNNENSLNTTLTADGFRFELPKRALMKPNRSATILVSAATFLGATRLDQTATATFSMAQPR